MLAGLVIGLPGVALATDDPLRDFVVALMEAVQSDGLIDLNQFDCHPYDAADPSFQTCRDPASGVGFMNIRDDGDYVSLSVEVQGNRDTRDAGQVGAGVIVPDRAAFDELHAAFTALATDTMFDGLIRCAMVPPPVTGGPEEVAGFAVLHPLSGQPLGFIFGGLNPDDAALLGQPPERTTVVASILILSGMGLDCLPPDLGAP